MISGTFLDHGVLESSELIDPEAGPEATKAYCVLGVPVISILGFIIRTDKEVGMVA